MFASDKFADWQSAVDPFLQKCQAFIIAIFADNGELVYGNRGLKALLKDPQRPPVAYLLNPNFANLEQRKKTQSPLFSGAITIGTMHEHVSVYGDIFYDRQQYLVVAEHDVHELAAMNAHMAKLNQEVNNLQRELIKEKKKLQQTLDKLKSTQAMLVHSEKMNALGQLVAGFAHEINNPLAFVNSNMHSLADYFSDFRAAYEALETELAENAKTLAVRDQYDIDFIFADFPDLQRGTLEGLTRVKKIVDDLRTFSRLDEAEWKEIDLKENIETTMALVKGEIKKHHVEYQIIASELPPVPCYAAELNQVFLNLAINAIQAMEDGGALKISLQHSADNVQIEFADTGKGIPEEICNKIFDPFFTTKPVGQGTGLGLSLVHQIITEKHHGTIEVQSTLNQGTTFVITLPIKGI